LARLVRERRRVALAETATNPLPVTLGLRALAALHSLLSLAFVALFLVALHRRFKMG
jgi:hypothetical protein